MIKVLIAEDEPLSLQNLTGHLRRLLGADALIEGAANGREAVDMARRIRPQLVLMDIEMPVMTGLDAAAIIHEALPETHIVFLTAFDRFDYAVGAMRAGGADYLLKPFDSAQINACLQKLGLLTEKQEHREERSENPFCAQFSVWLANHYMQDISLEEAAEAMGMSSFYFSRFFRTAYNRTFLEYLTSYRIERAEELLRQTDIPGARDRAACRLHGRELLHQGVQASLRLHADRLPEPAVIASEGENNRKTLCRIHKKTDANFSLAVFFPVILQIFTILPVLSFDL